jgi:hypothetical protein
MNLEGKTAIQAIQSHNLDPEYYELSKFNCPRPFCF